MRQKELIMGKADKEKVVMCFGDSNTWGCNPEDGSRMDRSTRWPGMLQRELGASFHVVEEGLGGRTTVWDDPIEGDRNGYKQLVPVMKSHMPMDLLVIMLGTNDLKNRFSVSAEDIARSVERLVSLVHQYSGVFVDDRVEVLVICPPPIADMSGMELENIFIGAEPKSRELAAAFRRRCRESSIRLINAGDIIESSPIDGIHLAPSEHATLGRAVAEEIRQILCWPKVK